MKIINRIIILVILLVIVMSSTTTAQEINLSSPIRNSYPFLYWQDSELKGMHIDLVTDALKNLGYDINIEVFPLKRCVRKAEKGEVAGIISIPYDSSYSNLDFPADAASSEESKWRIMQVDNVVVTYINDNYEFEGQVKSLTNPVRIIYGEKVLDKKLTGIDARVEKVKTNIQNFKKLMRDQQGVLITTTVTAENMYQNSQFENKIKIHHIPVTSLSHHLAFANNSNLKQEEKQAIWDEIARLRSDYVYMLQLYAQY